MSLREQLLAVRAEYGSLTAANVLDAARAIDHPLHSRFEWDDSIAAERYRESQASDLIRKVKLTFADSSGEPKDVRAFLVVRGDEPTSEYVPTEEVMADPFTSRLILQEFQREWKAFKARYEHLAEFAATIRQDVAA